MKLKDKIKSFINGMGSINLFPPLINLEELNPNYLNKYSSAEQDSRALAGDWNQVGKDMDESIKKFEEQYIK